MAINDVAFTKFSKESVSNASYDTLYTVPASTTGVLLSCIFTNKTAAPITIDVQIVRSGGTPTIQFNDLPIPVGSGLDIVSNKPIVLSTGDVIKAQASAATSADCAGSVLETT
jgi:hypothetical protein